MLFYPTSLYQSCRARLVECERHKGTDIPGRPGLTDMWGNFKLQNIYVSRGQKAETFICDIYTARRAHVGQLGTSKQDLVKKKIVPKGQENNEESAEVKRTSFKWIKRNYIIMHEFQGGSLNGINSSKLLRELYSHIFVDKYHGNLLDFAIVEGY